MAKINCKSAENVWHMLIGYADESVFNIDDTAKFVYSKENVMDFRQFNLRRYEEYPKNCHHIRTECYYKIIIPHLARLWDFPWNPNDFDYEWIQTEVPGLLMENAVPKTDFKFSLSIDHEFFDNGNYKILQCFGEKEPYGNPETMFHRLYKGGHKCSRIINETIDNDRKILISGDSFMIPLVPILACYFKEVVLMDNRTTTSQAEYFENIDFDIVCFEYYTITGIEKTLIQNFQ